MCGRYGRRSERQAIERELHAQTGLPDHFFAPTYNAAPTQLQPAVRLSHDTGDRKIVAMRWGLLKGSMSNAYSTINARNDALMSSALWRQPFLERRCLIPASFFYEWEKKASPKDPSIPHLVKFRDDRLFAFGGIYWPWRDPKTQEWFDTFSIITVEPNRTLEPFHNRCPLIIPPSRYEEWLTAPPEQPPLHLVETPDDADLTEYKCNPAVGNVRNNSADLVNTA